MHARRQDDVGGVGGVFDLRARSEVHRCVERDIDHVFADADQVGIRLRGKISAPYRQYLTLLLRLHALTAGRQEESVEADELRDAMDYPWQQLSDEERECVRGLSADLLQQIPEGEALKTTKFFEGEMNVKIHCRPWPAATFAGLSAGRPLHGMYQTTICSDFCGEPVLRHELDANELEIAPKVLLVVPVDKDQVRRLEEGELSMRAALAGPLWVVEQAADGSPAAAWLVVEPGALQLPETCSFGCLTCKSRDIPQSPWLDHGARRGGAAEPADRKLCEETMAGLLDLVADHDDLDGYEVEKALTAAGVLAAALARPGLVNFDQITRERLTSLLKWSRRRGLRPAANGSRGVDSTLRYKL